MIPTELTRLDGSPLAADAVSGKVVLFVNVASECGYTRQYAGLQSLQEALEDKGFTVVGVPCNQFGGQEPGTAEQIASFCERSYRVTFPLLAKQDVNGGERSPLYRALVGEGAEVRWNFEKFLVDRSGQVVARFGSRCEPESAELRAAIEAAL